MLTLEDLFDKDWEGGILKNVAEGYLRLSRAAKYCDKELSEKLADSYVQAFLESCFRFD